MVNQHKSSELSGHDQLTIRVGHWLEASATGRLAIYAVIIAGFLAGLAGVTAVIAKVHGWW